MFFITIAHKDRDDGANNGARNGVLVLSAMAIPLLLSSHGFFTRSIYFDLQHTKFGMQLRAHGVKQQHYRPTNTSLVLGFWECSRPSDRPDVLHPYPLPHVLILSPCSYPHTARTAQAMHGRCPSSLVSAIFDAARWPPSPPLSPQPSLSAAYLPFPSFSRCHTAK